MDYAGRIAASHDGRWAATPRFLATRAGADDGKSAFATCADPDRDDQSRASFLFIHEFVADAVHRQQVSRLARFHFNLAAHVLHVRVDRPFVGFEGHTVDGVQ